MTRCFDYAGIIHVHSVYSDGLSSVKKIMQDAQKAKCDFLVLSDHDTLRALPQEGVYGKTLLLVGEEITVGKNQGHYLAMNLAVKVDPHLSAQETINRVSMQGGLGFLAHPFAKTYRRILALTPVTWKNWDVTGYTGLEIWNYSQNWKDNLHGLLAFPSKVICPRSFHNGPLPAALKTWDHLLRHQKVTGLGSVDAHGIIYSYQDMFKTLHTHVLLKKALSFQSSSFQEDKKMIYQALKEGNCYLSNDYVTNATGFSFIGDNGEHQAIMGEKLSLGKGVLLTVSSPEPAVLRIVREGKVIARRTNSRELTHNVQEPGAYRAEVFCRSFKGMVRRYRPWIFSNPVYVVKN